MKIFSLQSKTGLVVWSLVLGIIINQLVTLITDKMARTSLDCLACSLRSSGWPFTRSDLLYQTTGYPLDPWGNLFFWILVVLIIFSLIRHFRNKKANPSVSS